MQRDYGCPVWTAYRTSGPSTSSFRLALIRHNDGPSKARRVAGSLSYSFISPHSLWNRCLLSSIMSRSGERRKGKDNASFEAQGEEPGRCQRFAEFEAERIYHRVHRGRNTESREGWGNFVGLRRVIIGVGELWELLDRI